MMSLFFPYAADFLSSAQGKVFQDHTILDQKARAEKPPDRRSHQSNTAMPAESLERMGRHPKTERRLSYRMEQGSPTNASSAIS